VSLGPAAVLVDRLDELVESSAQVRIERVGWSVDLESEVAGSGVHKASRRTDGCGTGRGELGPVPVSLYRVCTVVLERERSEKAGQDNRVRTPIYQNSTPIYIGFLPFGQTLASARLRRSVT
jgi:hypothetical protein